MVMCVYLATYKTSLSSQEFEKLLRNLSRKADILLNGSGVLVLVPQSHAFILPAVYIIY